MSVYLFDCTMHAFSNIKNSTTVDSINLTEEYKEASIFLPDVWKTTDREKLIQKY